MIIFACLLAILCFVGLLTCHACVLLACLSHGCVFVGLLVSCLCCAVLEFLSHACAVLLVMLVFTRHASVCVYVVLARQALLAGFACVCLA